MQLTMQRYEAQAALFAKKPSRRELLDVQLPNDVRRSATVNVWRNHAFETLEPLMQPYCLYGNWRAAFTYGAYDDSFGFQNHTAADTEILWIDSNRFTVNSAWIDWLKGRIVALRGLSKAPIIVATWIEDAALRAALQKTVDGFAAVYFADLQTFADDAKVALLDARTAALAGTPVSNAAQLLIARVLACHWLPAALFPPVKAVAVDLDHTLHQGVLGEEGIAGVMLMEGHLTLQHYIKSLRARGIFIALVSRNERADVEALFAQRTDYPLRWEDFSVTEISWDSKADAIARIAKELRIAPDAVLFIDDNPGELSNVALQLPQVHTVYAHPDAALTTRVVQHYPALWRWKIEAEDAKRIDDLAANSEREALAATIINPAEYFRSLEVALTYAHNPQAQLSRLADLCNKTNQFNLAMRRFTQAEVAERMASNSACVSSVALSDRLSDSGVIAVLIAEREGDVLVVTELCISCRAMGRNLEDTIVLEALRGMPVFEGCTEILFRVQHGPRNGPALAWLGALLGNGTTPAAGDHRIPAQRLIDFTPAEGVTLLKE